MSTFGRILRLPVLLLLGSTLLPGCGTRPRAPALMDEPVYQSGTEGFRFLAPEKWTQHAKAEIPPGKVEKERLLVGYRRLKSEKPALLEVSRADLDPTTDLTEYLAAAAFSSDKWRAKTKPEVMEINGLPAVRNTFVSKAGREEMTREVVTIRKGERVYIFSGMFPSSDGKARDEVRRSVGSVMWKE